MATKFELEFESKSDTEFDTVLQLLKRTLPPAFVIKQVGQSIQVEIKSDQPEDQKCQYLIDRELDRIFFLTSRKIHARMITQEKTFELKVSWRVLGSLPAETGQLQRWTYELAIQVRLWSMAVDIPNVDTPNEATKFLLLYQIIELSHPKDVPKYQDHKTAPHPIKECKLLRDLIVHAGDVSSKELKSYCDYLNLPELMSDVTDPAFNELIRKKLPLVEEVAKEILEGVLR